MRFYVAGRFQNYLQCRYVMDRLKEQGHAITYDWTRTPAFDEHGHPRSERCTHAENVNYAWKDLAGVREADILVLLADASLAGAYIEMGYALAFERDVYVVSPSRQTIFFNLPLVTRFGKLEDLFFHTEHMRSPQLALIE